MIATLRQRNFALLWLAGLVSYTGDWVMVAALPVFVFEQTGSTFASGMVWLVYALPGLLVGSFAGVFVDRWDRRRTMIGASLLQAALMPLLLLALRDGWLWLAYVVIFVETVIWTFFSPAENALLPRLVGEERLVTANALNTLNDNLARIAGPAIGGVVLVNTGLAGAVLFDAASYLIAALLILGIAVAPQPSRVAADRPAASGAAAALQVFWREWREGLRLVWSDPMLRSLMVVTAIAWFADSLNSPLIVPFLLDVVGAGTAAFGLVLALRGIAGLLGGVVIGRFGPHIAPARLLGWSLLAIGAGFLVMINVATLPVIVVVQLALGPAIVGWISSQQTLLQTASEDRFRGRLFGVVGTAGALMGVIGTGAGSVLGELAGIVPLFNVSALFYAGAGVLALVLLRPLIGSTEALMESGHSRNGPGAGRPVADP